MANPCFATLLVTALALPMPALSQTSATEGSAPQTPDCAGEFTTLDADANGYLSETESPRDYARASIDGATIGKEGLGQDQFLQICSQPAWGQAVEEGAPLEGANSFTEEQARERALAWNVNDVTGLMLDDQGIWRGKGTVGGKAVSVAIDFKGNVVTTPDAQ